MASNSICFLHTAVLDLDLGDRGWSGGLAGPVISTLQRLKCSVSTSERQPQDRLARAIWRPPAPITSFRLFMMRSQPTAGGVARRTRTLHGGEALSPNGLDHLIGITGGGGNWRATVLFPGKKSPAEKSSDELTAQARMKTADERCLCWH